ncbi:hypothetical protein [Nitrolancea hollandica]|uniref:hypothetical protein n=1 Tax=Nitrolancea hollandica TaxID=1206749 RepID=UPI00058D7A08|nr:hypothetical protein [Nitrolancea hollandica]
MPDLDILDHAIAPGWQKPFRLLAGDACPEDVGHAILGALCRSLRQKGGLPQIDRIQELIERVDSGSVAPIDALNTLRKIEVSKGGHRHTRIAARAASKIIVAINQGDHLSGDVGHALIEVVNWELIDHHLFGRARPVLIGQRFADYAEFNSFEAACKRALRPCVTKLADSLVSDPAARRLRAPRMPLKIRRPTVELLNEPIILRGQ